ncbi:transcription initiation factor TFIID subunit 9 [Pyrus ussuriensis x Pyrus communis]|uniref:Transcription initiation factor TFIID subunit 9 n=1 Tax=Pyrus ussuriensis x Pyrus communis TaxID=2448454 RepID=A0A5N5G6U6_9ROSA|nr:transcription initiation factor TFIID subunit 9 [Pyrus ussuriensis x Pyrus communis]
MAGEDEDLPRDTKIVKTLLKSMGLEEYEPRVVHQFLELWYRYVVDVLSDAQVYSEHAGKAALFFFSSAKSEFLWLETETKSRYQNQLQGLEWHCHLNTLISPNYQLAIPKKQPTQATEEMVEDEEPKPSGVPQNTPQRVSFPLTKRTK